MPKNQTTLKDIFQAIFDDISDGTKKSAHDIALLCHSSVQRVRYCAELIEMAQMNKKLNIEKITMKTRIITYLSILKDTS